MSRLRLYYVALCDQLEREILEVPDVGIEEMRRLVGRLEDGLEGVPGGEERLRQVRAEHGIR